MKVVAFVLIALFVVIGVFAPLIANDAPIVAKVNGDWQFPAFASYVGERRPAPGAAKSWAQWESRLAGDSADWAVMPPIPYGPTGTHTKKMFDGPTADHWMGNDDTGRDVFALVIHGATTALWIAIGTSVLALLIGVPLGAVAGYFGGFIDLVVTGVLQVFLCFPPLFFILAIAAFLGSSLVSVIVVLGLLYWVSFARIVRGEFLSLREREFVKCARGLGIGPVRLIFRHILPAAKGPIFVNAAFVAASAVVVESTLTFLGVGPDQSAASWGMILRQAADSAHRGEWHLWLFPSLALIGVVACLHSLADRARR